MISDTETADPGRTRAAPKPGSVRELEREAIIASLRRWEGRRIKAAEELGFLRRTLLNKIKEYGIDEFKDR